MVLVNSTWTYNHIHFLWKYAAWKKRIRIVYPPCSLPSLKDASSVAGASEDPKRQPIILSIGQFRPEKDHMLQIEAMSRCLQLHKSAIFSQVPAPQLVLIGGCRNPEDERRLHQLQQLCDQLNISDHVTFVVNEPFAIVQEWLNKASIGVHTVRYWKRP
jgi:alpha-1,2-mannosyltransferase